MQIFALFLLGVVAWAWGSFAATRRIISSGGWRIAPIFSALATSLFVLVGLVVPFFWIDCFRFMADCAWTRYQLFGTFSAWFLHLLVTLVSLFLKRFARIRLPLVGLLFASAAGVMGMVLYHAMLWNP